MAGFQLYTSSIYHCPLTTSIRIADEKFAELNMKIAKYEMDNMDLM